MGVSGWRGGASQQGMQSWVIHLIGGEKAEIIQIQMKGSILVDLDDFLPEDIRIDRFAVGSQAHELVFPGVDSETTKSGDR